LLTIADLKQTVDGLAGGVDFIKPFNHYVVLHELTAGPWWWQLLEVVQGDEPVDLSGIAKLL